jgi:tetratricopeptide (TPR) repeat protein
VTGWLSKYFKKDVRSMQETISSKTETKRVSNEVKNNDLKINVSEWVKAQKASGVPLMDLWKELNKKSCQSGELELMQAYMKAADKIEDIVVSRNVKGKEYEREGEESKAIRLYESNIKDNFDGSHPYERLRVIYTKHKRYEDIIRVCQSYIKNGQHDPQLKAKYEELIIKLKQNIDKNE